MCLRQHVLSGGINTEGCEERERTLGTGRSTSSTLPWIRVILSSKPLSEMICLFSIPPTRDQCAHQRPRSSLLHHASRASTILVCNKGAKAKRDKATREEGTLSRERRWGLGLHHTVQCG
jgi:hypothetical protein